MTSFFAEALLFCPKSPSTVCAFLTTNRSIFNSSVIPVLLNLPRFQNAYRWRLRPSSLSLFELLCHSHTLQFAPTILLPDWESWQRMDGVLEMFSTLIHERRYFCRSLKHFRSNHLPVVTLVCENVHSLVTLHCNGFDFDDRTAASLIKPLTLLRTLNVSFCKELTDAILVDVGKLSSLTDLDISRTQNIRGHGLPHLKDLTLLRSLNIYNSCNSNPGLSDLPHFPSLQVLVFSSSSHSRDAFSAIAKHQDLTTLEVAPGSFADASAFRQLSGLSHLVDLDVAACQMDDECLAAIAGSTFSLRRLRLGENSFSDAAISGLITEMPELTELGLSSCRSVSTGTMKAISNLKFLTDLDLLGWNGLDGFEYLKSIPNLKRIAVYRLHEKVVKTLLQIKSLREVEYSQGGVGATSASHEMIAQLEEKVKLDCWYTRS